MADFVLAAMAPPAIYWLIGAALCGYLAGSLPFGLILTRLAGFGDVRQIGSGNIGATNVLRTGNKKIAAATLLADMLKGTIVAIIFALIAPSDLTCLNLVAGFFAFLGHLFPLWLSFKGGKGVATYLGVLIAVAPWGALTFALVWLATARISRYSSLSALLGVIATAASIFFYMSLQISLIITLMSLIILAKHHANIKRLLKGTETRINLK